MVSRSEKPTNVVSIQGREQRRNDLAMAKAYILKQCPEWKYDINSGHVMLFIDSPSLRRGIENNLETLRLFPDSMSLGAKTTLFFTREDDIKRLSEVGVRLDQGCWPSPQDYINLSGPSSRGR